MEPHQSSVGGTVDGGRSNMRVLGETVSVDGGLQDDSSPSHTCTSTSTVVLTLCTRSPRNRSDNCGDADAGNESASETSFGDERGAVEPASWRFRSAVLRSPSPFGVSASRVSPLDVIAKSMPHMDRDNAPVSGVLRVADSEDWNDSTDVAPATDEQTVPSVSTGRGLGEVVGDGVVDKEGGGEVVGN